VNCRACINGHTASDAAQRWTTRGRGESMEDGTALAILIFVIGAALVGFAIGLSV
jgi:hypothetical protein